MFVLVVWEFVRMHIKVNECCMCIVKCNFLFVGAHSVCVCDPNLHKLIKLYFCVCVSESVRDEELGISSIFTKKMYKL